MPSRRTCEKMLQHRTLHGRLWEMRPCMSRLTQVWELTWGEEKCGAQLERELESQTVVPWCITLYNFWPQLLGLELVQTSFPNGFSIPAHIPSIAGGLNQMWHFSEPQTTSCEVAQPEGRDRHWCSKSRSTWVRSQGNWDQSKAVTTISWEHHTARGHQNPCCFGSFLMPCHGRRRQSEAKGCYIRSWF